MSEYRTYVIRNDETGHLKIGGSTNIAKRLGQLQTGSPHNLSIIGTLDVLEKVAQETLDEDICRGEWFQPTAAVHAYVIQHMTALEAPRRRVRPAQPQNLDDYREEQTLSSEPITIYEQLELAGLGLAKHPDLSWMPEDKRPKVVTTDELREAISDA